MSGATVLDVFREHAARRPEQTVLGWFNSDAQEVARWSMGELYARSQGLAGRLLAEGCRPGERVLLIYPPGLDFFEAFLACLWAGLIPAPVYPPNPMEGERLGQLTALCQQLDIRFALTNVLYSRARMLGNVRNLLKRAHRWPNLTWLTTDSLGAGAPPPPRVARPDEVAFLQFTSGSTSAPRGVQITFANLKHQLDLNRVPGRIGDDTRAVVWLPQYHDFGLITSFLNGLYHPFPVWFCSPLDFLKRPACWPEMMHKVQATHTASPNFGYALVARKTTAAQRSQWDLSHMRCCTWGAEVIRPETVRAFQDAFAVSGLRPEANVSGWGLAEHCVAAAVAQTAIRSFDSAALQEQRVLLPVPSGAPRALELANAGGRLPGVALRIIDAAGRPLPEGHVGEVVLQSDGIAAGYACDPDATRDVFEVAVQGAPGPWLRSGDLGAVLDGMLYITGRLKELIIVRGRNLYPTDVEASARGAHPAIRPGGVAAVGLAGADGEALGVVVEVKDAKAWRGRVGEIAAAVHGALTRDGFPLHVVAVARPGAIPKTTSGKLRRASCAEWLAAGDHKPEGVLHLQRWAEAEAAGASDLVGILREALARLPGLPAEAREPAVRQALERCLVALLGGEAALHPEATLVELGLDSLKIADLIGVIEEASGVTPDPVALAALDRLEPLAAWLVQAVAGPAAPGTREAPDQAPRSAPATPFQRLLLGDHGRAPAWFGVIEVDGALSRAAVEASLAGLAARHDVLRARFLGEGPDLRMEQVEGALPIEVAEVAPAAGAPAALGATVEALRAAVFQPFDLSAPPLFRAALTPLGPQRSLVAFAAHHLIYDAVSIAALMVEWVQRLGGAPDPGPAPSFLAAAQALASKPASEAVRGWWRAQLAGARWPMPVPTDVALARHHMVEAGGFRLDLEATARLTEAARRSGATLNALACLGFGMAMASTLGTGEVLTGLAVSTRGPRQREVVGPLVDDCLLRMSFAADQPAPAALRGLGEQMRQAAARIELGFEGMVDCVRAVGTFASRAASLCPVLYSYHDWDGLAPQAAAQILQRGAWLRSGPLRLRALPVDRRASDRPYDYFALAELRAGCLAVALRVQDVRVGAATGEAIVSRWRAALDALAEGASGSTRSLLAALAAASSSTSESPEKS